MTRDNRKRAARQRRLSQYDPAVLVAAREALGLDDAKRDNEAAAPRLGRPSPLMDAPAADRHSRRTSIVATTAAGRKTIPLEPAVASCRRGVR